MQVGRISTQNNIKIYAKGCIGAKKNGRIRDIVH